jgi:multiple sugar transport system permease protein
MAHHDAAIAVRLPAVRRRRGLARQWRVLLLNGGGWVLSTVALFVLLFPVLVMLSTSLKTLDGVYHVPPVWVPSPVTFQNFADIWAKYPLATYMRNSLVIGIGATVLNLAAAIPAGYAVARLRFRGRQTFMLLLLLIQMFSPVIVLIPLFKIMAWLHWLDTYWSLIATGTVFTLAFSIWMLASYFRTIPAEIEEAALVDGCTRAQTILRIALPVAAPGVVTTIIYVFISVWNEFIFALTFISRTEMRTLTVGLYTFIGRWAVQWHYLMAAALVGVVPVVILFMLVERHLVRGLALGAVK